MKYTITIIFLLLIGQVDAKVYNLKGHIRITQTAARGIVTNYLINKASNYALRNIEILPTYGRFPYNDTNTFVFSISTNKKTVRDEMVGFMLDKFVTYSIYIGTGTAIYRHICHDDGVPGECESCTDELIWSK